MATWWNFLATDATVGFDNLWEDSLENIDKRTAPVGGTPLFSMHLVDLHGGPLSSTVLGRLSTTNVVGTGPIRTRGATSDAAAALSFTDAPEAPAADNLPCLLYTSPSPRD